MTYNPFVIHNRAKKLVRRSSKPIYKGQFALTTNVTAYSKYDAVTKTMKRAAESMADPWFLHFKIDTDTPADAVRLIPTILQSFNRTRTLRRARISGIRLCNLWSDRGAWFYCSDLVVSCSFDAVAISSALAEYSSLGTFLMVSYSIPVNVRRGGSSSIRNFAHSCTERFWQSSKLARHAVRIAIDTSRSDKEDLWFTFEPITLSPLALLAYILNGYSPDLHTVEVGLNSRLVLSRSPMFDIANYSTWQPDKMMSGVRYKHAAAFGTFYNNPDFPII